MNTRAGGTYVPPAKLRALQASFTETGSKEYQRLAWEALKKSINGLINKVNKSNIRNIAPELFAENLIRGRGAFARSVMKAQAAALSYTPIYAALVAIVNAKLPQVGELLLGRLIIQFRKAFKRNDKAMCLSSTAFIAHLCNQQVAHEIVALQILALLLERPTDSSVEIAVGFMREIGAFLAEVSPKANNGVFDRFRTILHETGIDTRVQYMIEVLFQERKDKYKDHPIVAQELDLVDEEEQITHQISLDDEVEAHEELGVFQFDPEYESNEAGYAALKREILGDVAQADPVAAEQVVPVEPIDADAQAAAEETRVQELAKQRQQREVEIQDETQTDLTNLRRTIYLTIMSSVDYEECTHKLLRIQLQHGQQRELCNMVVECCSQERAFGKFYGLIAERFCRLNRNWTEQFEACFGHYYETIHRYDANKLRNIAKLFGYLLANDAIAWQVLGCIRLTEQDTTSSSRIFVKVLFQDLQESVGLKPLAERMADPGLQPDFANTLFPTDDPKNTRFSINYFTSIGLGVLTEDMRERLKEMQARAAIEAAKAAAAAAAEEAEDSYSSGYDTDRSYSSRSESEDRGRSRSDARRRRSVSYSSDRYSRRGSRSASIDSRRGRSTRRRARSDSTDSRSLSRSRSRSRAADRRKPATRRARSISTDSRSRSRSRSRSPPRRNGQRHRYSSDSRSRSDSRAPLRKRRAYSDSSSYDSRSHSRSRSRSRSPPRYSSGRGQRREPVSPPRRSSGRMSPPASTYRTPAQARERRRLRSRSPPPSTTRADRERLRHDAAGAPSYMHDTPTVSAQDSGINPARLQRAPWLAAQDSPAGQRAQRGRFST